MLQGPSRLLAACDAEHARGSLHHAPGRGSLGLAWAVPFTTAVVVAVTVEASGAGAALFCCLAGCAPSSVSPSEAAAAVAAPPSSAFFRLPIRRPGPPSLRRGVLGS